MSSHPTDLDLIATLTNGGANAPRGIDNGAGSVFYNSRTGRSRRLSRASLSYKGVNLDVEYLPSSCIGPEAYVEDVVSVEVAGVNIEALLSEEQLEDLRSRIEQGWDVEAQS